MKTLLIVAALLAATNLFCQTLPLSIGDQLPKLKFDSVVNDFGKTTSVGGISKPTLIEFWGTTCTSCLEAFPKFAAIKEKYSDQLSIVMVTSESRKKIDRYFEKRKELKGFGLPTIFEDSLLHNLFPHETVPHLVWVSRDGTVQAITGKKELSETNVEQLLTGRKLSLSMKVDNSLQDSVPLLKIIPEDSQPFAYSLFTDTIADVGMSYHSFTTKAATYFRLVNFSAWRLYSLAFLYELNPLSDSTQFLNEHRVQLSKKYCYELKIPNQKIDRRVAMRMLHADLDRYFGVESRVVTSRIHVNELQLASGPISHDIRKPEIINHPDYLELINTPLASVVQSLNHKLNWKEPFFYNGPPIRVTVTIRKRYRTLQDAATDLEKAGIIIKSTEALVKQVEFY